MKKVGIFGGSFDPIHNGHIRLARYVLEHTDLDEVWLMVSPLNPLKSQGYKATDDERLEMARLAVDGISGISISDFEFFLPIPSYTYKTLRELKKAYPDIEFRLIIGGDNWASFGRWRNPEEILKEFGVIVYPRPGEDLSITLLPFPIDSSKVKILADAPQMPVSSTGLRDLLANFPEQHSETLSKSLPSPVIDYLKHNNPYSNSHLDTDSFLSDAFSHSIINDRKDSSSDGAHASTE